MAMGTGGKGRRMRFNLLKPWLTFQIREITTMEKERAQRPCQWGYMEKKKEWGTGHALERKSIHTVAIMRGSDMRY